MFFDVCTCIQPNMKTDVLFFSLVYCTYIVTRLMFQKIYFIMYVHVYRLFTCICMYMYVAEIHEICF